MKNKFIVLNTNGDHEYTITTETTDNGVLSTLYRSSSEIWSEIVKNEKILSIINDGNGVELSNKLKKMNYHELFELRLLLNFENKLNSEINQDKYKIIKETVFLEM